MLTRFEKTCQRRPGAATRWHTLSDCRRRCRFTARQRRPSSARRHCSFTTRGVGRCIAASRRRFCAARRP